jgi:hypothetical protein
LVERHEGVLLRKVNIESWSSEAGRQAGKEFGVTAIPFFCVFGKDGALLEKIRGGDLRALEAAIRRGLR